MTAENPNLKLDQKFILETKEKIEIGANLLTILPFEIAKRFDDISIRQLIAGLDFDIAEQLFVYIIDSIATTLADLDESPYIKAVIGEEMDANGDIIMAWMFLEEAAEIVGYYEPNRIES